MSEKIVIVGAGISGLSCAFWLLQRPEISGKNIVIYERASIPGGWIKTISSSSGQIYETGPRSLRLQTRTSVEEMISKLSLESEVIEADPSSQRRYILMNGILEEFPANGIRSLFQLPLGRKLLKRAILEPVRAFIRKKAQGPESVAQFFERIFPGDMFIARLINAYTSGIWAADAKFVSSEIAFPTLKKIEKEYGSLTIGALFHKISGHSKIISFRKGLSQLPFRLATWLQEKGVEIHYNTELSQISRQRVGVVDLWKLDIANQKSQYAKWVIFGCEPTQISGFHTVMDWQQMKKSSVVSLSFGWKEDLFGTRKRKVKPAFGVLAPYQEEEKVLGVVFDSHIFQKQNVSMKTRMTVMIGGTRFPEAVDLCEKKLSLIARDRLQKWIEIDEVPNEVHCSYAYQAISIPEPSLKREDFESEDEATECVHYLRGCDKYGLQERVSYRIDPKISLAAVSSATAGVSIADCICATQKLANVIGKYRSVLIDCTSHVSLARSKRTTYS